jgi:1,4-dihydroxy-2-naphthoate octaprenyltransferase
MTAVSVTVGSLLALHLGYFHWGLYLLVLVGMILAHAATNLINDYFDVRHGVDRPEAPTARYRPHPLLEGLLTPGQVLWGSFALYALAGLIGLYLITIRGWPIALLAILGGVASFTYTAGPIMYKHRALGELSVFLMWGPLMIVGAFYVQTGSWEEIWRVIWPSVPIGLWVALVLLANNLKDIDYDDRLGVKTLGTLLGRQRALRLYMSLVVAIYLLSGLGVVLGAIPIWGLMVFLSIPMAFKLIRSFELAPEIPADADPRTAQLATQYGVLLIVALLLEALLPLS